MRPTALVAKVVISVLAGLSAGALVYGGVGVVQWVRRKIKPEPPMLQAGEGAESGEEEGAVPSQSDESAGQS